MQVWRICKARYAETALSGEGARLFAGRWNLQGAPLVYTSRSLALAAVELFVHLDPNEIPNDLVSMAIEIPKSVRVDRVETRELPVSWRRMENARLRELGNAWILSARSLALEVPSAAIDGEWNVLINPAHPDFHRVRAATPKPFVYDERMFRR